MKLSKNIEKTLKAWEKEYKKGFTAYMILVLLKEESMHGYGIKTKLEELTNNKISFKDSGIYQILKKLNNKDFVTYTVQKSEKGPNRKCYSINDKGEELVNVFTEQYIGPIHNSIMTIMKK